MQPIIARVHRALAWLVLAGLVGELYLVGAGLFASTTFQPHRTLGSALALAIVLLLVLALIARPGRCVVGLSALLVVLTTLQVLLPSLRTGLPWAAALHAVNALALMGVTAAIARSPGSAIRDRRPTGDAAATGADRSLAPASAPPSTPAR